MRGTVKVLGKEIDVEYETKNYGNGLSTLRVLGEDLREQLTAKLGSFSEEKQKAFNEAVATQLIPQVLLGEVLQEEAAPEKDWN